MIVPFEKEVDKFYRSFKELYKSFCSLKETVGSNKDKFNKLGKNKNYNGLYKDFNELEKKFFQELSKSKTYLFDIEMKVLELNGNYLTEKDKELVKSYIERCYYFLDFMSKDISENLLKYKFFK